MKKLETKLIELNSSELIEINGGIFEILLGACALGAAVYGAGYACGQAYYHYINYFSF